MAQETAWLLQIVRLDISMEIIWSLMLTVCFDSQTCIKQSVQWFEEKPQCIEAQLIHEDIPLDGDWKSVDYKCVVVGAKEA